MSAWSDGTRMRGSTKMMALFTTALITTEHAEEQDDVPEPAWDRAGRQQ